MKIDRLTASFAIISIIICSLVLRHTGEPRPLILALAGGIIMSLILNLGLILISINSVKKKYKKILTIWMVLSLFGVALTVGGFFPYLEFLAAIFHIWLIVSIWRKSGLQAPSHP